MKEKNTVRKLVTSAMLAALVCVATMLIKVPSPLHGYMNLGDCVVLLCGFTLSPFYAFLAAGVGSALADVFSGYILYAPATFAIKGAVALCALGVLRLFGKNKAGIAPHVVSSVIAECVMIFGYFVFEGVLYGFAASLVNIPANAVQGAFGVVLGVVLERVFRKSKISF